MRLLDDSLEHWQVQGTRFKMTSWSPLVGANRDASEKVIVFYGLFVHLPVLATGMLRPIAAVGDQGALALVEFGSRVCRADIVAVACSVRSPASFTIVYAVRNLDNMDCFPVFCLKSLVVACSHFAASRDIEPAPLGLRRSRSRTSAETLRGHSSRLPLLQR